MQLAAEGLIEVRPGLRTVAAELPASTAAERSALLKTEVEQMVVEAKRMGLDLDTLSEAVARHWPRWEGTSDGRQPEKGMSDIVFRRPQHDRL